MKPMRFPEVVQRQSARGGPPPAGSAGELLRLVREGHASTRADLAALTGLARSTVSQRIEALLARGLLYEAGEGPSTGGRPPVMLAFNPRAGVVLAADLGATHSRTAVTDLEGTALAESRQEMEIAEGPDVVLEQVQATFDQLLAEAGVPRGDVVGIGVGLPGPVEFATGRPVNPPIMPGWDGVRVPERFAERFGADVPVLVDNDVNIMAAGEHWTRWASVDDLLFIKVGTGIGCGIVAGGRIHRGAQGAAGDLGHIQVPDTVIAQVSLDGAAPPVCRCGNVGCVEAVAGGGALARRLAERGYDTRNARDVVRLVRGGDAEAGMLVRTAGRVLGEVLAAAVNLFNPAVIVIGGDLARAHEQLLAGVREIVYSRSLPLATRHLEIVRSTLDDRAGITGAASMVIEHVLSPAVVDAWLAAAGEVVA
jgi:predicted NBD/HSP70 family sugar kinase